MGTVEAKLQRLAASKADIKSALTEKGRTPTDVLSTYGDEIRNIKTGDQINNAKEVTVIAEDQIKIGDTVYTMANSGSITADWSDDTVGCYVTAAAISPDGSTLVLGGSFPGYAKIFAVTGQSISYVGDIYADTGTTPLDGIVETAAFSPDGSMLVLGGHFDVCGKIYSVSGKNIIYISDICAADYVGYFDGAVHAAAFSVDGSALFIGGAFTGYAASYAVSGNNVTYAGTIFADASNNDLDSTVTTISVSADGAALVLGGAFTGYAKIYAVSGTNVSYVSDIYADANATMLDGDVAASAFSPGGVLVLGGSFSCYAKIYSLAGTALTFISDVYANDSEPIDPEPDLGEDEPPYTPSPTPTPSPETGPTGGTIYTIAFSDDGSYLALGGGTGGCAHIYSMSGASISFISEADVGVESTAWSSMVYGAVFVPGSRTLVLGGRFPSRAKVYTVDATSVAFSGTIYVDPGTNALSGTVEAAAFSADGKLLVLGGSFSGYAKIFAVSGRTITYLSDIYSDTAMTELSGKVYTAAFAPDGNALVLGGDFAGYAKIYSVDGASVTYVSNIYANAGTTALSRTVYTAAFAPDGNALVLGGYFSGFAKVYSASGTTITYVSNIYADTGTTVLSSTVETAAFSPDGQVLVLGGSFSGRAKVYSASGATITYVSNIYANAGTATLGFTVETAAFSLDGTTLMLGGSFSGRAKIYSVSGRTITYLSDIYSDTAMTELSGKVYTAAFAPDGNALVLGGDFAGYAAWYRTKDVFDASGVKYASVPAYGTSAYLAENGLVPAENGRGVGFAISDLDQGASGTVKVIGTLDTSAQDALLAEAIAEANESWAGSLTFSGSYASTTYYTAAGCYLSVDKQSGRAFVTIQSGTSTSYENVLFNPTATLPTGVTMLAPETYTHTSNSTQRYYTCVLTGITGKINVAVNLDTINSSYDYVRATLTVTYA